LPTSGGWQADPGRCQPGGSFDGPEDRLLVEWLHEEGYDGSIHPELTRQQPECQPQLKSIKVN